jgi:oxazoline/thiazoline dehydrogenase
MDVVVSLFLLDDISLVEMAPDRMSLTAPAVAHRAPVALANVTPGLRSALEGLRGEGAPAATLFGRVLQTDGPAGLGRLTQHLNQLQRHAMLGHRILLDGAPLASIQPLSTYYRYDEHKVDSGRKYVLSRFAYCRAHEGGIVLESPLGHARVRLQAPPAHAALLALSQPRGIADIAGAVDGLGEEGATLLMNFLANAAALVPAEGGASVPEDADHVLAQWDFHDLLFHSRSRLGRHSNPYGGTYSFKGKFDPLPIIKPPMSADGIPLWKPDLAKLAREDPSFTTVLEARRSIRAHGEQPITGRQLGEFLYRSARVQKMVPDAGVSFRPHPAGGAIHELEIYPLIDRCDGLDPSLYHYNPAEHRLYRLSASDGYLKALLRMAAATATLERHPQILLIIAARFQRMQLKYQSMTYSVILKNVGALFQTMYLVATAMGLAPNALGGGHSDLFADAAGLDYLAETSVGEFILGSSPGEIPSTDPH